MTNDEEGAWRITESHRYNVSEGYVFPKRYMYCTRKTFERQLKIRKNNADHCTWRGRHNVRLLVERFDGTQWVEIEDFYGPQKGKS